MRRILCINTGGLGNLHGSRMRRLTVSLGGEVVYHDLDRCCSPWQTVRALWKIVREGGPWDLIYQEGTSILAGACLIRAKMQRGQRFIVSSGDPIGGFFSVTRGPLSGKAFGVYERQLYRACAAFIGWTPYLTGMALQMGARRGVTVEGGADLTRFRPLPAEERAEWRARFGLPVDHLVCAVVGSLAWSPRARYCYGLELVEALRRMRRTDVSILIVGDGTGRERLQSRVPADLRSRAVFTGRLDEAGVVGAMNAADVGFVTQSLDGLGNYRLTTKLPEYLACGLPVAMSPTPGFYDYVREAGWALPPFHPASAEFHAGCAAWLDKLTVTEILARRAHARPLAEARFDDRLLAARFGAFVDDLLREPRENH